jgi:hypothetical protein
MLFTGVIVLGKAVSRRVCRLYHGGRIVESIVKCVVIS